MNEIGWTLLWASIEEFVSGPTKHSHVSSELYFHHIRASPIKELNTKSSLL